MIISQNILALISHKRKIERRSFDHGPLLCYHGVASHSNRTVVLQRHVLMQLWGPFTALSFNLFLIFFCICFRLLRRLLFANLNLIINSPLEIYAFFMKIYTCYLCNGNKQGVLPSDDHGILFLSFFLKTTLHFDLVRFSLMTAIYTVLNCKYIHIGVVSAVQMHTVQPSRHSDF